MHRTPLLIALTLAISGCSGTPDTGVSSTPTPTPTTQTTASEPPSIPHATGLHGRLIYTKAGGSYRDDTVFTSRADGSGEHRVPGLPQQACCPRVSPDGSTLFYAAVTGGDRITTGVQRLTSRHARLLALPKGTLSLGPGAWSPDGARIAAQGWDPRHPGADGIYLVDAADGGHRTRLTHEPSGVNDVAEDFSADGNWLIYVEEHEDAPSTGQLLIVELAHPEHVVPLTTKDFGVGIGNVRVSPDGELILFADGRLSTRGALWTVHPDGTGLTQVWDDPTGFASHPAWSPDGTQIVFSLNPIADDYQHTPNALVVIRADGTQLRQIIGDDGDFRREATWIP